MAEMQTDASDSTAAAERERTDSGERRSTASTASPSKKRPEVGEIAQKAKVPAIAVGAGLAGLAGGAALARHGDRRKVLGVSLPRRRRDSAVGKLGDKVEELTSEVRDIGDKIK